MALVAIIERIAFLVFGYKPYYLHVRITIVYPNHTAKVSFNGNKAFARVPGDISRKMISSAL